MSETIHSTGDSGNATRRGSPRLRLLVLGVLVLSAVALVIWIRSVTWQRVTQLEREFAAIESERFLLGVHARESVVRMDAALLRFQLSGKLEEQQTFQRIGRELTNRLARTMPLLTTQEERVIAADFARAYATYQAETADMIERSTRPIRKDTLSQIHEIITAKSRHVARLSEDLVNAQAHAWKEFLAGSGGALSSLRRMLWISFAALLAFTSIVGVLAYGTFVAPLRAMLTESQAIIERHEKLASLGTLAAGVAHEIRNPLQAIKMRLFSLKQSLPAVARDNEDLAVIANEINRLERIVKETLQFARPGEPEMTVIATADLIGNVADLLGGSLRKCGVQLEGEADKALIRADRQQIQQVLINLVLNGAESIEGNGIVTVRARADVARLGGESRPVVRLEVADTGRGISGEAQKRIFDPFFSTKEGGTGLGLAIAARIVEKHGGFIQYSTQAGRGTTFTVVLPRHVP